MKRNPTPEQKAKAEERRARLHELAERVAAMTDNEKAAMLDRIGTVVTCEGHPLSMHNTMMLAYQSDNVSMVGGYQQWQKIGRQVRKGEKSLGIWIPKARKDSDTETDEPKNNRPWFVFGSVFDISQTDPITDTATA